MEIQQSQLRTADQKDLEKLCLDSDIIISAIGIPEFIKGNMIKKGSSIIDVGITRVDDLSSPKGYKIVGDVDFKSVSNTVGLYYSCSWWRWTNDNFNAIEKYTKGL